MNKEDLEFDLSVALDRWTDAENQTLAGVEGLTKTDLYALKLCCDYYDEHGTLMPMNYFSAKVKEVLTHYGML